MIGSNWRALLQEAMVDSRERERIAQATGVSVTTLKRWAQGENAPRVSHLDALLQAIPTPEFQRAIEFYRQQLDQTDGGQGSNSRRPGFSDAALSSVYSSPLPPIPSEVYAQVLKEYATPSSPLAKVQIWSVVEYALQHALRHLDPLRSGIVVCLAQCMPPQKGVVRCLREVTYRSTLPSDHAPNLLFLGAESLAGYALAQMRLVAVSDLEREQHIPHVHTDYEASAVSVPILHHGHVAGCLLVSSCQKHFFTQEMCELISQYAHLLALAFPEASCYEPAMIRLQIMPPEAIQLDRFQKAQILQRMRDKMVESLRQGVYLSSDEAESQVWQELEEECLTLAASS